MKKIISCMALLLTVITVFTSCSDVTVERSHDSNDCETSMFVIIEDTVHWQIVYHKDTKVMYSVSYGRYNHGNFTLLVNPDGTPMIYGDGYSSKKEEKSLSERANSVTTKIHTQDISYEFDIMSKCGYTASQLKYALSSENHKEMIPYVKTILYAEKRYGVNALYLMCKLGLESGWGRYESGKNNIGGWMSDDGTFMDFDSVDECILHIARSLSRAYKDEVGTKLYDVCERYCPGSNYSDALISIMVERTDKISEIL